MKQFANAIRVAVSQQNWHGALALALTIPDVCGRLENPTLGSEKRYKAWWDRYAAPKFHNMLGGSDAYALRCAYLHEGTDDILNQRAAQALSAFIFIEPRKGSTIHCNQINSKLQLQVDIFCTDICDGVDSWVQDVQDNAEVQRRMNALIAIRKSSGELGLVDLVLENPDA